MEIPKERILVWSKNLSQVENLTIFLCNEHTQFFLNSLGVDFSAYDFPLTRNGYLVDGDNVIVSGNFLVDCLHRGDNLAIDSTTESRNIFSIEFGKRNIFLSF